MVPQTLLLTILNNTTSIKDMLLKGSNVLSEITNMAKELFPPNMSLDDLRTVYSKPLDMVILETENKTGHIFVGGEFRINYIDPIYFGCSYELYFQDASKKWIKTSSQSNPIRQKLLSEETRNELLVNKELKFDIDKPSDEIKAWYAQNKRAQQAQPAQTLQATQTIHQTQQEK
ncbi:MAG: hypothetical protein E7201_04210 [Selenomonas ruminantium]|uniref:Uncharacterized protein n=1 Tax=Selenomonas ruminantium TaxID=971 RepID=A0A927WR11_SELRU|nr:hypothetical protein [Selenomonas ruminantium]